MSHRNFFITDKTFIAGILALLVSQTTFIPVLAKQHVASGSKIQIDATPEIVFEAIRKQRNTGNRKQVSADKNVFVIEEKMDHVPIYGKVDCTFEETEYPYKHIDYKMLKSSKFKESFGTWILTPGKDNKGTTLEFDSYTDSGLMIPFGSEITKNESIKTSKIRLAHIKEVAEEMMKSAPAAAKPAEK